MPARPVIGPTLSGRREHMGESSINTEHVRRVAATVNAGDVAMLANAIEFCGSEPGFKGRLPGSLEGAYDQERVSRLRSVIRRLSEPELIWLCENHTELTRKK